MPTHRASCLFVFLLLVATALGMRFYRLGDWSFGFDELYTTMETRLYFDDDPVPEIMLDGKPFDRETSQFYRLPKLLCVAYFVQWLDYRLFGDDEFGSRVFPAAIGSLSVGMIFLLARPLFGFPAALTLALLILLCPNHVLESQDNRFYCQAFFLINILLLLGGHVAKNRSFAAAFWSGPVAVLLALTHSMGGLLWGFFLLGILFDFFTGKRADESGTTKIPWRIIGMLFFWSALLVGIALLHILPLIRNWNAHAVAIGMNPIRAAISMTGSLGWAYSMLFVPSLIYALSRLRTPGMGYWLLVSSLCGLSVLVLPLKIVYYPYYNILFLFPFFVLLAVFFGWIYRLIADSDIFGRKPLSAVWLGFVVLLNLPMLGAYYLDGGRFDFRDAYRHVREHWQPGDRITGFTTTAAHYYAPELGPMLPLGKTDRPSILERRRSNLGETGRLWIILEVDRHEPDFETRRWLYENACLEARFGKKNFNFFVRDIEVFTVSRQNRPQASVQGQ